MATKHLNIEITASKLKLTRALVDARADMMKLGDAAKKATSDVSAASLAVKNSMNAGPPNPAVLKNFENLKVAAAKAKAEFQASRVTVNNLGHALSAQGVSVGKATAEYVRMKNALAAASKASAQLSSQLPRMPTRNGIPNTAAATTSAVSSSVQLDRGLSGTEASVDRLNKKIGAMGHLAAGVFLAQRVLPYAASLGRVNDEYIKYNAQLALATKNGGDLATAQADVARIAKVAQTGLAETAQLYARLASSVSRLGVGQAEVAKVTEAVALSLRVSGATAAESASAILQLSQAFGSGVLRGEEFNAVNEASPRLMQALADAIGKPRGELRKMAEEGQLTSKVLALALPKALDQLRNEAASMPMTIGGAFTNLSNEFTIFIGKVNQGVGVFSGFANVVNTVAANLQAVIAGVAAAFAAYLTKKLVGTAQIRIAEAVAARAQLAEVAARTVAEGAQVRARLTGLAAIAAAERGVGVAAAASGAAQAAAGAAAAGALARVGSGLGVVLRLLGGPVGLAASIAAATVAWLSFRKSGTDAIDGVIARQRELLRLQNKPAGERAAAADPRSAELDQAEKELAARRAEVDANRRQLEAYAKKSPDSAALPRMRNELAKQVEELVIAQNGLSMERAKIKREAAESAKADAEREKMLREAMEEAAKAGDAEKTGKGGDTDPLAGILSQTNTAKLKEYEKNIALLAERWKQNKISAQQYTEAVEVIAQRAFGDKISQARKEEEDAIRTRAAAEKDAFDEAMAAEDARIRKETELKLAQMGFVDGLEREAFLADLSNDARETALLLLEAEKLGIADINRLLELQGKIREGNAKREAEEALKKQQDSLYESVQQGVQRAFADGLNAVATGEGGIRGALQGIVDMIRNAMSNAIAGSLTESFMGMLGGKDGVLNLAGMFGLGGGKRGDTEAMPVYVKDVSATGGLTDAMGGEDSGIGGMFSGLMDGFTGMMSNLMSSLMGMLSSLMSGLGGGLSSIFSGIGGLFGFADGGYTGPGGKYQPAGVVHAGEYVFSADAVRRLGISALDNMHRFATGSFVPRSPRWGYADGGAVNLPVAPTVNTSTRIINMFDLDGAMSEYLRTRGGERAILNIIQRNPGAAGA